MYKGKNAGQPEQAAEPYHDHDHHDHHHVSEGHGHSHPHDPAQKTHIDQRKQATGPHDDDDHHDRHRGGHGHSRPHHHTSHDAPEGQSKASEPHHDHDHHDHHHGGHGHSRPHHHTSHDTPEGQSKASEPHHDHDHHDHQHGGRGHGHHHPSHDIGQPQQVAEPHHEHDHHDHQHRGHGHSHPHHHPSNDVPRGQPEASEPHHGHDIHGDQHGGHSHSHPHHQISSDAPRGQPEASEPHHHDHQHASGGHGHGRHHHPAHDISQLSQSQQAAETHHDRRRHPGHGALADQPKQEAEPHNDHQHVRGGDGHGRPDRDPTVKAKKVHFSPNEKAFENYPNPIERGVRTALALLEAYAFDKDKTTVLDFVCGTGIVSKNLAPYAYSIKGIDTSQEMVHRYNERFAANRKHFSAVCVELKDDSKELKGKKFDVVFCASAYHNFSSVEEITRVLVSYLKPGGAFLVVDMTRSHAHPQGFSKHDMRRLFEGAGLKLFSYKQVAPGEGDADIFIAKGIKAASA